MSEKLSHAEQVAVWKGGILSSDRTPLQEFKRMTQEVTELEDSIIVFDGSAKAKKEVEGETADVAIGLYGIAYVLGFDLDGAIREKLVTARDKYPRSVISRRMAQGVEFDVAMAEQKTVYEKKTDWDRRWQKHTLH